MESKEIGQGTINKQSFKNVSTSIKGMLRSQKGGKRGIYIRVTINREQDYYPTGYYVFPKDFDIKSGFVKAKIDSKDEINSLIRHLVKELDMVLSRLKKSEESLSIHNFHKHYALKFKEGMSFQNFSSKFLNEKKGIEPSTLEVYQRVPKKLFEFASSVLVSEIDKAFIKNWEQWLLSEKELCQNTTNHYLETLRTFLIQAIEDGIIEKNPFSSIKISKIIGERDYLTEEELNAFLKVKIPVPNTGEIKARELFAFCCLTGIRYSDMVNLKWENIRKITSDMYFKMVKTKTFVTIPLIKEAKAILERQEKKGELVFKRISNQKMNEHLHRIEKRAGIQKNITVHVARHTFATLALERGMPLEVVSKILGHKNIRTTMIYAKVTQRRLHDEMQKMNGLVQKAIPNNGGSFEMKDLLEKVQMLLEKQSNMNSAA